MRLVGQGKDREEDLREEEMRVGTMYGNSESGGETARITILQNGSTGVLGSPSIPKFPICKL